MTRYGWLIILFWLCAFAEAKTIKTVGKQKPVDISHDFFMDVLYQALTLAYPNEPIKIEAITHPGQARVIRLMQTGGYYDIVWSANTDKRNKTLLPIEFPLLGGGLGLRGFVIQESKRERFESITSLQQLQSLVLCQGLNWPDALILRDAGLTVYEVPHFDAMLSMVELGRCDAMPLSVYEGYSELKAVSDDFPKLIFFTDVVLQYDLVMNFYVNSDQTALRDALLPALIQMYDSGVYAQILETHQLTRMTNQLWQKKGHSIIPVKTNRTQSTAAQRNYFSNLVLTSN